jgi:hypothetical protein
MLASINLTLGILDVFRKIHQAQSQLQLGWNELAFLSRLPTPPTPTNQKSLFLNNLTEWLASTHRLAELGTALP